MGPEFAGLQPVDVACEDGGLGIVDYDASLASGFVPKQLLQEAGCGGGDHEAVDGEFGRFMLSFVGGDDHGVD